MLRLNGDFTLVCVCVCLTEVLLKSVMMFLVCLNCVSLFDLYLIVAASMFVLPNTAIELAWCVLPRVPSLTDMLESPFWVHILSKVTGWKTGHDGYIARLIHAGGHKALYLWLNLFSQIFILNCVYLKDADKLQCGIWTSSVELRKQKLHILHPSVPRMKACPHNTEIITFHNMSSQCSNESSTLLTWPTADVTCPPIKWCYMMSCREDSVLEFLLLWRSGLWHISDSKTHTFQRQKRRAVMARRVWTRPPQAFTFRYLKILQVPWFC